MKNLVPFSTLFFCLFGFCLKANLHIPDVASMGKETLKSEGTFTATSTNSLSACNTPTGLYTDDITQTTATFNWSPVWGAVSYSIQTRLPYGTWYNAPGNPYANNSVTLGGFDPGTTYQWRVKANCTYGQYSYWSQAMNFTTGGSTFCVPPDGLNTYNITQTTATWDWSPVSGAISYSVQWRYAGGTWYTLSGGPWTNTHLNVGGLQPSTAYEWRVRSNCSYGISSEWSYSSGFTTLGSSCNMPTGLYTTNITESSATFNWASVPGAQSYSVQVRLPNGIWYYIPGSPFTNTSATAYNLSPGTTYQWRVRTNCNYGDHSDFTPGMSFTTNGSSACYAPNELSTYNITQTTATWDWSPVSGAVSYSIQWRYAGGTWYTLSGGPWTNTVVNVAGLLPSTAYEWRVRSNCANGSTSVWSYGASFTTLGSSCNTPTGLATTNITETSATFSWSAVPGAQSYSVQTRLPNGIWYYVPGSPFMNTTITVNYLSPGTTYEWRVRANCAYSQHSNWTPGMSFTTSGSFSCDVPGGLVTTNITSTTATWDWAPASGAVSYSVQWRYAGGTWYNLPGGPWSNTILNIAGLQPNTTYEWRVRSNCGNGMSSAYSYAASFTTLGSSCNTPTGLSVTNITETTATFNWSAVSGAQSYSVQTRVPNGIWYSAPGSPFMTTSATVSGFSPGTTYEWRVRTNCTNGQQSAWSTGMSFTTSGSGVSNDFCSNAIVLPVGSMCMNTSGSNVYATPSSPPPMGGCPSSGYQDVWFRFTMPNVSYPTVTIRTTEGTLTNAVMEVYVGNSCTTMSYLACEDDNLNGNGSLMPVINISGGPNITIWVRVWGYNGSTGTFSICVLNYQSMDITGQDNSSIVPITGEILEQQRSDSEIEVDVDEEDISHIMHVAPNPARDVLYVSYVQTTESIVSGIVLTDMSGKIMLRKEYESNGVNEFEDELDVSGLTPGIYILQLRTTKGILTEKISVVD